MQLMANSTAKSPVCASTLCRCGQCGVALGLSTTTIPSIWLWGSSLDVFR